MFSVYKGRPLVKPMMIVTITGYIIDVLDPYFANGKNKDANIFTALLRPDSTKLRQWLEESDIFVVDRVLEIALVYLKTLNLFLRCHIF